MTARIINVIVISPLEMVRTYLQALPPSQRKSRGTFEVFRSVSRGGLSKLFIGLNITLIRDAPFSAI